MQDRESQSDVNPGIVEQDLDDASVEREGMQGGGGVEREGAQDDDEGLRGGPITERERPDGGQITQREAFEGQTGREGMMHGSRSGGSENMTDGSDPMPPAGGTGR
ncbi:MAG TPA: hypothetical protein VE871_05835 [Longimicrobium sp.]|nr:hypothetical protein [Longimicrobium sp.]